MSTSFRSLDIQPLSDQVNCNRKALQLLFFSYQYVFQAKQKIHRVQCPIWLNRGETKIQLLSIKVACVVNIKLGYGLIFFIKNRFILYRCNQIKFENPISLLPLKRFIVRFLTTLNPREKIHIKAQRLFLANSYFYNYKPSPRILLQHRVLRNLRKNKDIVITKPDKRNGVVILDWKLYNFTLLKK